MLPQVCIRLNLPTALGYDYDSNEVRQKSLCCPLYNWQGFMYTNCSTTSLNKQKQQIKQVHGSEGTMLFVLCVKFICPFSNALKRPCSQPSRPLLQQVLGLIVFWRISIQSRAEQYANGNENEAANRNPRDLPTQRKNKARICITTHIKIKTKIYINKRILWF